MADQQKISLRIGISENIESIENIERTVSIGIIEIRCGEPGGGRGS